MDPRLRGDDQIWWTLLLLLVLVLSIPTTASARPWLCLPPAFDQGRRVHPLPNPDVYWLEVMLRQHELCWRAPQTPDELRLALFGNSAVYGFPLPVEETLSDYLNQHFARTGTPAHMFNLGFVTPYQVRDAVMIHEVLAYEPDIIVYPMTLAEFRHLAPMMYPTASRFFNMNARALYRLAADSPDGLEEPVQRYVANLDNYAHTRHVTDQLQDVGLYARRLARSTAESLAADLNSPQPRFQSRAAPPKGGYDCTKTSLAMTSYGNWKDWNVLAYLDELQRRRGVRVLVVHWPVAHEPKGNCFSVRFTNDKAEEFSAWIRHEAEQRQLAYLDLRDLLAPEAYIDSLHLKAEGHRQIADRVAQALEPVIRAAAARRAQVSTGSR